MRTTTLSLSLLLALGLIAAGCRSDVTTSTITTAALDAQNDQGEDQDGDERPFTYAVIGDFPYGPVKRAELPALVDLINADPQVERVIHLGDIKAGSSSDCSDTYFLDIRSQFDRFADAFVYTPGDNEWTDCHVFSKNNGLYTPTERLIAVRQDFFPVVGRTLGIDSRPVTSQGRVDRANAAYIENVLWRRADVLFATFNITGSNNDKAPWTSTPPKAGELPADAANYPSQAEEQATRAQATDAWLRRAFTQGQGAKAIVLAFQADMWDATSALDGFDTLVTEIGMLAARYGRPVLLLEGDSHIFRVDQPYTAASPLFGLHPNTPIAPNVTRMVVNGSASRTEYVRLTIDPKAAKRGGTPWTMVEVPLQ
jgi:hypothetical protein